MGFGEYLSIVAPVVISLLVATFPTFAGDYVDRQAGALADHLAKSGMSGPVREEVKRLSAFFAQGAILCTGWWGMMPAYIYAAVQIVPHTPAPSFFTAVFVAFGICALGYFMHVTMTLRLFEWSDDYVRNPKAESGTFAFTHFQALTAIAIVASLLVLLLATVALF